MKSMRGKCLLREVSSWPRAPLAGCCRREGGAPRSEGKDDCAGSSVQVSFEEMLTKVGRYSTSLLAGPTVTEVNPRWLRFKF